jgi:ABC-2 type transport system ATP-binding protein
VRQTGEALQVEDLTRRYGTLIAVDRISLSVSRGELLALLGPNGAGKTTLMRMICGLLRPHSGKIRIFGAGEGGALRNAQRNSLGYCPQSLIVWRDLTCTEQLVFVAQMFQMSREQGRERAETLLGVLGLSEKADELAANLSGGMQRRLNIALALVHDPDFLILDEPAAGLDPQSRILVREVICCLAHEKNKAVMVSTHDMDEADRLADRVAVMDHGRLLVLDTPGALKSSGETHEVLEVDLFSGTTQEQLERAAEAVRRLTKEVVKTEGSLVVKADRGEELVGEIRQALAELSIEPTEIRYRKRTLEDVFIDLTGRRLRD